MKYRIAIADDHKLFRMGIIAALEMYKDIEIIFEAGDGNELLALLEKNPVDVILLDLKMPNKSGFEALKNIRMKDQDVKILILSMHGDEEYITFMMEAKANGYLLKNAEPEEIYKAILSCMNTGYYFNNTINPLLLKNILNLKQQHPETKSMVIDLNPRELKVLQLLCNGLSTEQIAKELYLGKRSIEGIKIAMQKSAGVNNTISLILFAIKHNLVTVEE